MEKIKKSYIRLVAFECVLLIICFLNSFVFNFLNGYKFLLFMLISFLTFSKILDIEKDRHRYTKIIIVEIFAFLLLYFLLYYLSGLLIGFYKNSNYYNWYGLITFILPTVFKIIIIEILRYATLVKSEKNVYLIILNVTVMFALYNTNLVYFADCSSAYSIFIFLAIYILPSMSENIAATYLTLKLGYKPIIFYMLVINLYSFLFPIIPNYSQYLYSMMMFLLPIVLSVRIYLILKKTKDEELNINYKKKRILSYAIPTIVIVFLIYFSSGYFKYYTVAIASGSMSGTFEKGDVVILNQKYKESKELEEGEIIAFKHDNIIVVHRIIKVLKDNDDIFYYTKGDANDSEDGYPIVEDEIIGTVEAKIKYIGIPRIWLNELG